MAVAGQHRLDTCAEPADAVEHVDADNRCQKGGFDVLPVSGVLAGAERGHHAERPEQAGQDVARSGCRRAAGSRRGRPVSVISPASA